MFRIKRDIIDNGKLNGKPPPPQVMLIAGFIKKPMGATVVTDLSDIAQFEAAEKVPMRLLDDDKIPYFEIEVPKELADSDDEDDVFAPLDYFGVAYGCTILQHKVNGKWVSLNGEVHFAWILNGKAIQDVWLGYREDSKDNVVFGTTVRFYDEKIDAWRSTWISPLKGLVQMFIGRKVKDEIILELQNTNGYPENWIFSEITSNSFRWRSEETHDKGKTWMLTEEMQIKRMQNKP
jgi:hypothetical protein